MLRIRSRLREGAGPVGAVAALITTLCCLGVPAFVGLVSALGAGFLINDRYLAPLLAVVLLITVTLDAYHTRSHRQWGMPAIALSASLIVYWAIYGPALTSGGASGQMSDGMASPAVWRPWLAYGAVGVLFLAQIWDLWLLSRRALSAPTAVKG